MLGETRKQSPISQLNHHSWQARPLTPHTAAKWIFSLIALNWHFVLVPETISFDNFYVLGQSTITE